MSFLDPAKPYAQMATDITMQHMRDQTQNNSTASDAQNAFSKNMIDLMSQVNAGNTALFNAQTNNLTAKNDIATKNPLTFAKQAALADMLSNIPQSGGHGASTFALGPEAKAAMTELSKQGINNLIDSPNANPIPTGANTAMTPTTAVAPTIKQFTFDDWKPENAGYSGK